MPRHAIDVHTHVYLPRYMDVLRGRNLVPRIAAGTDEAGDERLIILPGEDAEKSTAAGRPVGGEFWDPVRKLAFMDAHDIAVSVISLANPWLDFLPPDEAVPLATALNEEMQAICAASGGRLYGFGVLPTPAPAACADELRRLMRLDRLRGVIIGARGLGKGLDDPALTPVWHAAEETGATIFVHPHYGVATEHFAGTGHTLFLALGFTFETTIAVSRLILSGVLDRHEKLQLLIAHAGATLPYLAGRLDGCVATDYSVDFKLRHRPSDYLRRMTFDAIAYHGPALKCLVELVGADRVMFGTDHPFFAPRERGPRMDTLSWSTAAATHAAIDALPADQQRAVARENAMRLLRLE
jgi:predicted TIM-barrel fold metal-dependent hydrolase